MGYKSNHLRSESEVGNSPRVRRKGADWRKEKVDHFDRTATASGAPSTMHPFTILRSRGILTKTEVLVSKRQEDHCLICRLPRRIAGQGPYELGTHLESQDGLSLTSARPYSQDVSALCLGRCGLTKTSSHAGPQTARQRCNRTDSKSQLSLHVGGSRGRGFVTGAPHTGKFARLQVTESLGIVELFATGSYVSHTAQPQM